MRGSGRRIGPTHSSFSLRNSRNHPTSDFTFFASIAESPPIVRALAVGACASLRQDAWQQVLAISFSRGMSATARGTRQGLPNCDPAKVAGFA
jgi:hypothetical protein